MSNPSPPKPWERGGMASSSATMTAATLLPSSTTSPGTLPPPLPDRPESLASVVNRTASNYSSFNSAARPFGSPYGYGGGGGFSSYQSPYNRFGGGGFGSMYGSGGYGGYGGGMGGGMYGGGMPGMYGGMPGGMPGDPNNPSLTQTFSQSTQATFQLIESIVGAFGGFAQMLESTYMATHSSFFAMVSVAEQFGNLRHTLGSVLGIYTLIGWLRTLLARLTGQPLPARSKDLTPAKFAAFNGRLPDGSAAAPRPSRKPLVVFALAVFGLPYLMGKLIKALAARQEEQAKQQALMEGGADAPLDPNSLTFCRVLYDYVPEAAQANPAGGVPGVDLAVKRGDLVAVLSRADPLGNASQWWRCRTREGGVGYLPAPYLEVIQRRGAAAAITSGGSPGVTPAGSRAQTMTSAVVEGLGRRPDGGQGAAAAEPSSRTSTLTGMKVEDMISRGAPPVTELVGKGPEAIPVESFQRSMFNTT